MKALIPLILVLLIHSPTKPVADEVTQLIEEASKKAAQIDCTKRHGKVAKFATVVAILKLEDDENWLAFHVETFCHKNKPPHQLPKISSK